MQRNAVPGMGFRTPVPTLIIFLNFYIIIQRNGFEVSLSFNRHVCQYLKKQITVLDFLPIYILAKCKLP